jgi:hypothetical protein
MSAERKEWVVKLGKVVDAKDAKEFGSYFTSDGIFRFGNQDAVAGPKAVEGYVAAFFTMISQMEHRLVNLNESGNTITWQGQVRCMCVCVCVCLYVCVCMCMCMYLNESGNTITWQGQVCRTVF